MIFCQKEIPKPKISLMIYNCWASYEAASQNILIRLLYDISPVTFLLLLPFWFLPLNLTVIHYPR